MRHWVAATLGWLGVRRTAKYEGRRQVSDGAIEAFSARTLRTKIDAPDKTSCRLIKKRRSPIRPNGRDGGGVTKVGDLPLNAAVKAIAMPAPQQDRQSPRRALFGGGGSDCHASGGFVWLPRGHNLGRSDYQLRSASPFASVGLKPDERRQARQLACFAAWIVG